MKYCPIILIILLVSCKKDQTLEVKDNFLIKLYISNVEDGQKVYLRKQEDNLTIDLDSTIIQDSKAQFSGSIKLPEIYGIFLADKKEGLYPIIEEGTINIKANPNDYSSASINGTPLNDQLALYKSELINISSKMNELFHEFQKARAENNSNQLIEINRRMNEINNDKNSYSIRFIKENPGSFVASMVLHSIYLNKDIPNDTIAKLYALLSDTVQKSEFSKNIALDLKIDTIRNTPSNEFN